MTLRTVPVAPSGLEGWTSCCKAAVTFHDETLICKACYEEVLQVPVDGELGRELDAIIGGIIRCEIAAVTGVERQTALGL